MMTPLGLAILYIINIPNFLHKSKQFLKKLPNTSDVIYFI